MTVNLTTFEPVLRVQKLGNGPQEGPEDREEAWGVVWSANLEKMGNLGLQEGELPKLLCIVLSLEKTGDPGSGKPTAMERCKSNNQL